MGSAGLQVLDATVFVDCPAGHDLVGTVAEILAGNTDLDTARAAGTEVLVTTNADADPERAAERPGGFLFFASVLEVYAAPRALRHERAEVTGLLLTSLWSRGMAAVAACEYEDLLPAAAGTDDRSLPWPGRSTDPGQRAHR